MTELAEKSGSYSPLIKHYAGKGNMKFSVGPLRFDIHKQVFPISAISVVVLVLFCLIFSEIAATTFVSMQSWLTTQFDWVFISGMNILLLFCLLMIFSPLSKVKIGGKESVPEYSFVSWFSMLFAAGMGIGLVFYGVLEPLNHTLTPPFGAPGVLDEGGNLADAATIDAAIQLGMAGTIYHWGLHAWAAYTVVALALGIFAYNKGLPMTIRSVFYPILGERTWGWPGHAIDTLAALATIAGLATSLGLGAIQASAGLNYVFGIEASIELQVFIIIVVIAAAVFSVVRGLNGGIKVLSLLNMGLALMLLLFILLIGPTLGIFNVFFDGLASYASHLPALSNWIGREDADYYLHGWTTFYWAWWISWSPFVGTFIARVSVGRSVRQFIVCVLLVPTLICIIWMSVFGGAAISQLVNDGYMGVQQTIVNWTPALSLFAMLEPLPLTLLTSFVGIVLVLIFFVTSADSGALVVDTICAGGKVDAPIVQRIFWCTFLGLAAIALLLGGGLSSLQALAVATGFPTLFITVVMCYCIYRGLSAEPR